MLRAEGPSRLGNEATPKLGGKVQIPDSSRNGRARLPFPGHQGVWLQQSCDLAIDIYRLSLCIVRSILEFEAFCLPGPAARPLPRPPGLHTSLDHLILPHTLSCCFNQSL